MLIVTWQGLRHDHETEPYGVAGGKRVAGKEAKDLRVHCWVDFHMEAEVIENDNKSRVEGKTERGAKFLGG